MYIADRIAAIFFNIAKFINKRLHHNFKSCGGTHPYKVNILVGVLYLSSTQFSMTLLTTVPTIYLSQRLFDFHIEVSLTFLGQDNTEVRL